MTLETLLNKLIEFGRKPRGELSFMRIQVANNLGKVALGGDIVAEDGLRTRRKILETKSINDLCSLDSGLWQFVCEKGLVKQKGYIEICNGDSGQGQDNYWSINHKEYDYRLMFSSTQEDKEKFLIDNIKI